MLAQQYMPQIHTMEEINLNKQQSGHTFLILSQNILWGQPPVPHAFWDRKKHEKVGQGKKELIGKCYKLDDEKNLVDVR